MSTFQKLENLHRSKMGFLKTIKECWLNGDYKDEEMRLFVQDNYNFLVERETRLERSYYKSIKNPVVYTFNEILEIAFGLIK